MANRVSDAEVKEIYKGTTADLTPFIDVANRYVTDKLGTKSLGSARLKDIELYMSAHMASLTYDKGGIRNERIGEAQRTYALALNKENLDSTPYGRNAIMLDTSETLLSADKKSATFRVL